MKQLFTLIQKSLAVVSLCLFCSATVQASIIVVDNVTTLTTNYDETFILTSDVTTGGADLHGIIFHNLFADVFTSGNPSNEIYDFRATVNGGSEISLSPWAGWNYRVGEDSSGLGWSPETSLGLLWNGNLLGGAVVGDSVRLFGSMVHDIGGFHHLPDFAPTTVEFSSYNGDIFATQNVSAVPVPAAVWLFGSGLIGLVGMRKNSPKVSSFSA